MRTLTAVETRRFYDRFGAKQDAQGFYERPALAALVRHADLRRAHALLELGSGTGRFAAELLRDELPGDATYLGVDVSTTMVGLATARLAPFAGRASVRQVEAAAPLPVADGAVDRFLATYVFDLLADDAIERTLAEARRVLAPGGLLCAAGITPGSTLLSRLVMKAWAGVCALRPSLVGGCGPRRFAERLSAAHWELRHREVVVAWGVASEVVVACRSGA